MFHKVPTYILSTINFHARSVLGWRPTSPTHVLFYGLNPKVPSKSMTLLILRYVAPVEGR